MNLQAIAIEEAETQIRLTTKNDYFTQEPRYKTDKKIRKIIENVLKKIKYIELAKATQQSLWNFYQRQYKELSRINGENLLVLLAFIKLTEPNNKIAKNMPLERAESVVRDYLEGRGESDTHIYGTEMRKYSQQYINNNIKPVFDRLTKQYPFDPASLPSGTDVSKARNSHINSLRNRAELEVRYNGHLENIQKLKEQGNKLVISSSHADCSERCAKWQGRVFSLDGTSGTTPDGRKFVPLEVATDVYYRTRAGKVWKNGLLGFNCRHYLVAYKDGYKFPKPNAEEERAEYAITVEQRRLERNVRYWRTRAIYDKGISAQAYNKARKKAIDWNNKYIDFSHNNGRAYYPSRTKIL